MISPDQRSVLALRTVPAPAQLFLYPTGAGESVQVTRDAMRHNYGSFTGDGKSIVYVASDATHPSRLYIQNLASGAVHAVSPPGVSLYPMPSRDSRWVYTRGPDRVGTLYPLDGGAAVPLPELTRDDYAAGWSADSRYLYFIRRAENPAHVMRLEIATHKLQPWREIALPESPYGINSMRIAPDGTAYVYGFVSSMSDLYLVEGVN
jgi:Tol biopolymer transport system component